MKPDSMKKHLFHTQRSKTSREKTRKEETKGGKTTGGRRRRGVEVMFEEDMGTQRVFVCVDLNISSHL